MKMETIFKASRADHGTIVNVIRINAHKYSVSAMCRVLQIPRSSYYEPELAFDKEDPLGFILNEIVCFTATCNTDSSQCH